MTNAPLNRDAVTDGVTQGSANTPPAAPGERRKLKADIAVIGAGSGGLSVAAGASMLGLNVVLFEKGEMGGDCLNYGCVPSKALLTAGRKAQTFRDAEKFGLTAAEPQIDWLRVRDHVKGVIETIAPVDSQERFEGLGVTVIREGARFQDKDTIVSDSVQVKARRIVVATGSTAFIPPIPGLKETPHLTNEDIFDIDVLPKHLVILGGGPIGAELGQAFRRLGSEVTIIEMGRALGRAEPEHAAVAVAHMRQEGVEILEGHKAVSVSQSADGVVVKTETESGETKEIAGSHLLVAVGRRAVLNSLDLEAGGVTTKGDGIETKANLRSVSNPRVWAVGDAAGRGQFTHLAGWHASVFVRNALFKSRTKADSLPLPAVTYLEPEVAQVGLTEAEAREAYGDSVKTAKFEFEENDRAIAERANHGGAKIVTDKKGVILGASVVGEGAGDIIQIVGVAMSNGLKIRALTNFISPYPTRAEVLKRAASKWYEAVVFGKSAKRLVGALQRVP
ncbi:MAG: FAD-dependent oxidoreductase [Pseudomonadota bacterium]